MDEYIGRHRGEPEFEVFEPGDRLRAKVGPRDKLGNHVFFVMVGGYCVEGDWIFYPSAPMTSRHFAKVGHR